MEIAIPHLVAEGETPETSLVDPVADLRGGMRFVLKVIPPIADVQRIPEDVLLVLGIFDVLLEK